jgi:hypothetical protein
MSEVPLDAEIWIRARAQTETNSPPYLLLAGGCAADSPALHGVYSLATTTINNRAFYRQVRGQHQIFWSAVGDVGEWSWADFRTVR